MFSPKYFGPRYWGSRYWGAGAPGFAALIEANAQLLGNLVLSTVDTGVEGRFAELGFRPSTPLLVYATDVLTTADITATQVPDDGHFLMSAVFLEPTGDVFTESGASAGAIGQRIADPLGGPDTFAFRRPLPFEVVWFVQIQSEPLEQFLLRFEDTEVWREYRSLPQRALDAQQAFDILDPDKVFDFYAKILGATHTQWALDNDSILDFIDPDKCPARFLDLLGKNFGLDLPADDSEVTKREKIRSAVPTFKLKGLARSVFLRLRAIGFQGFSNEIWSNVAGKFVITGPAALQIGGLDDNVAGIDLGVNTSANGRWFLDIVSDGGGFFHLDIYDDAARIMLVAHTASYNSTGTQALIADAGSGLSGTVEILAVGPADATSFARVPTNFEDINDALPAVQADALSRGIFDLVQTGTGQKGTDIFEAPHGYFTEDQTPYFPISRLSIHLNNPDGSPLDIPSFTPEGIEELKERVARELRVDIIPVHVDIRQFITDFEVGPLSPEQIGVSDALLITEVGGGPLFGFMGGGSSTAQPAAAGFMGGGANTQQPAAAGFVGGGNL